MPRYYCDYCDTYLTHDSPSVRKQHNAGYKHKANVRTYYQQFEEQQTQSLIDQRIKEHLGQAAAFQQVGSTFHQHLVSLPGMPQRPRLPVLPPPMMPIGATSQASSQLVPSMRAPVPMPLSAAPGYMAPPMQSAVGPPGASSLPLPVTIPPSSSSGPSNGAISMAPPAMYQTSQTATSGSYEAFNPSIGSMQRGSSNAPTDGYSYASADSNH